MSEKLTSDYDYRIIDAVSDAMAREGHTLGIGDCAWVLSQIEDGPAKDKLKVAVEVAVAFIRFSQDKKAELTAAQSQVDELKASRDAWEKHYNEMANRKDALLKKAHDEFEKTDHWYHSDIKEELAKELGL